MTKLEFCKPDNMTIQPINMTIVVAKKASDIWKIQFIELAIFIYYYIKLLLYNVGCMNFIGM